MLHRQGGTLCKAQENSRSELSRATHTSHVRKTFVVRAQLHVKCGVLSTSFDCVWKWWPGMFVWFVLETVLTCFNQLLCCSRVFSSSDHLLSVFRDVLHGSVSL